MSIQGENSKTCVWVNAKSAAEVAACDSKRIRDLARRGLISRRHLPGCDPVYLLSDVEKLVDRCTSSASA
jgi:hypothetical protein